MKVVLLAACSALCVSSALASFDMMLMPSTSTRINRHDPVNNVSLGGFTVNNTRLVTIDQSRGHAYVLDSGSNRFRIYNYSTGETAGAAAATPNPQCIDFHTGTNRILSLWNSGIHFSSMGSSTSSVLTSLSTATSWESMALAGDTVTVFGKNFGNSSIVYESFNVSTGASLGGGSTVTALQSLSRFGKAAWIPGVNTTNGYYVFTYINSLGNMMLARSNANVTGTSGLISSQTLTGFSSANVMPAAVIAHEGFFVVGQSSALATDTLIRKYDYFTPFGTEYTHTLSGTSFPASSYYQVANVVAPEPGSMIALGVGVAAVLRKRKARRS